VYIILVDFSKCPRLKAYSKTQVEVIAVTGTEKENDGLGAHPVPTCHP
jgi:hypothetical protein